MRNHLIALFVFALFFIPTHAHASSLLLDTSSTSVAVGDRSADTQTQTIACSDLNGSTLDSIALIAYAASTPADLTVLVSGIASATVMSNTQTISTQNNALYTTFTFTPTIINCTSDIVVSFAVTNKTSSNSVSALVSYGFSSYPNGTSMCTYTNPCDIYLKFYGTLPPPAPTIQFIPFQIDTQGTTTCVTASSTLVCTSTTDNFAINVLIDVIAIGFGMVCFYMGLRFILDIKI